MPYIFIDDGAPDARDWDSNYLYYDSEDLESMERVKDLIESSPRARANKLTAEVQFLERAIVHRTELERRDLGRGNKRRDPGALILAALGSLLT